MISSWKDIKYAPRDRNIPLLAKVKLNNIDRWFYDVIRWEEHDNMWTCPYLECDIPDDHILGFQVINE